MVKKTFHRNESLARRCGPVLEVCVVRVVTDGTNSAAQHMLTPRGRNPLHDPSQLPPSSHCHFPLIFLQHTLVHRTWR